MSILHFRMIILTLLALFLLLPSIFHVSGTPKINQSSTDLAIGNSHARAINFHAMGLVGHNDYEDGADVRQTINRYYELEKSLPSLVRVWIPVAPGYIFRDKTNPKWARHEIFHSRFFDEYLSRFFDEYLKLSQPVSYFWSVGKRQLVTFKERLLHNTQHKETHIIVEGATASRKILKVEEVDQLAETTALGHSENSSLQNTANIKRLEKFSEYLRQKDITLIFFTPPYTSEYYNHPLLADFESSYKTKLTQIVEKHSNTHYFDFHDLYQRESYMYFHDDDHLNLYGAKAFSSILQQAVSDKLNLYN